MTDLIIAVVVFVIVGAATAYIIKEKKKGTKCIGCPSACQCSGKKCESSSCSCENE